MSHPFVQRAPADFVHIFIVTKNRQCCGILGRKSMVTTEHKPVCYFTENTFAIQSLRLRQYQSGCTFFSYFLESFDAFRPILSGPPLFTELIIHLVF